METIWTPHRFSGDVLALDVANTVVMRSDPSRRVDRFEHADEIVRFAEAASVFRAEELGGNPLRVHDPILAQPRIIALREATDALFRDASRSGAPGAAHLAGLLGLSSEAIGRRPVALAPDRLAASPGSGPLPFETAVAVSALGLLAPDRRRRIRICDNCGWLFLDGSRNGSRVWCDMSVCGNRRKARRHYHRARGAGGERRA